METASKDSKRTLPEIELDGRPWYVDVNGFQLIDKEFPGNTIPAKDMHYSGRGYSFLLSRSGRCLIAKNDEKGMDFITAEQAQIDLLYVKLPNFTKMDPDGVRLLYGWEGIDVQIMMDYDVMVDRRETLESQNINSPMDELIFEENASLGQMTIEIPLIDFLRQKYELFKELVDGIPELRQEIERNRPHLLKLMEELKEVQGIVKSSHTKKDDALKTSSSSQEVDGNPNQKQKRGRKYRKRLK